MAASQKISLGTWSKAARLRTLPLAASSIITGCALGWDKSEMPVAIFSLALTTCILLQILSNFANDLGDYSKGTDNDGRIGPARALQSGTISPRTMYNAIVITGILSLISGLSLLYTAFSYAEGFLMPLFFFMVGLLAIAAAYKYTAGKSPYGYQGLGDIAVFLFFGIIGVMGSYYLQAKSWDPLVLLPASTIGLFCVSVLNLNNMRDHVNDELSGKRTLVVRMGFVLAKKYHVAIHLAAWICLATFETLVPGSPWRWIVFLPLPISLIHLGRVWRTTVPKELDGELKKVALSTFAISLLLLIVHWL